MPGFGGHDTPIVISTIGESRGGLDKFGRIDVIEGRNLNGYVVASNLLEVATTE